MTLPDVPRSVHDRDKQRLFPWRRSHVDIDVAGLVDVFRDHHPHESSVRIIRAFEVARAAHQSQVRRSGEPYITHPLLVAHIVAGLGLDDVTISAALLHDSVEDTSTTLEYISEHFGEDVASIVDGVTKLDRIHFQSAEAAQAATMRKMLVAMAKDIRVLIIKLADRLHNMRTIAAMPEAKQKRIAQETLDIYAPLAHRLGISDVKSQLEELCFAVLHPKRYASIEFMVEQKSGERQVFLDEVISDFTELLHDVGIEAEITGRPKYLWSIYEKMVVRGKDFNEVQDLVGVRVIVDSLKDCYGALGSIHSFWTPIQGRFKDYIAMPKFNLYQSLHTTVVGPSGKPVEVQIRTKEMHHRAEIGIAAHWAYKRGDDGAEQKKKKKLASSKPQSRSVIPADISSLPWLERIVDWQLDTADPNEFMDMLRDDLEHDELFVFTPKGKVITLPLEATPIDFAYAVHTDVGHRCVGAKVNGRLVPLNAKLDSGDTVEVFTSKAEDAGPSRDWAEFVVSSKAISKIRQWFSRERREDAIDSGKDDVIKELRRLGLPVQKIQASQTLDEVAHEMNYAGVDELYRAVGEHHISPKSVGQRMQQFLKFETGEVQLPASAARPPRQPRDSPTTSVGVHVEGLDDVMVRLARCCTPVPGDEIIGFITRGRGVSVHRSDCANAVALAQSQGERLIDVEWDHSSGSSFIVSVEIEAFDRPRLLQDIASMLSDEHVNILGCNTLTTADRIAKLRFDFDLADPSHLDSIIAQMRRVESVIDVYRILPGGNRTG
ncbi:MAG TPA: bifunctional (p)ppGpp synthetase/guanosine-3',5'-bis(diphosphate) 3'-pyrophosphohydrolase [Acidimicrobiia bacterium]|nr:bifunctional (p)ppGpp synthetase/guanosine-3',5'-bis(diphosphate) 3'-pyrophosphohydrolase [Acidimicrobiia bacterium]